MTGTLHTAPSRKAIAVAVVLWLIGSILAELFIARSGNVSLILASIVIIFGATAIVAFLLLMVVTADEEETGS
jgi:hypothetical protein